MKPDVPPLLIAPDTNSLLHFKRPDLVDWTPVSGRRVVVLVFVANTLREIEKHKDGLRGAGRERAREISSWFRKAKEGSLNTNLRFDFHPSEPQDFTPGLDPSVPDDRFVASILDLQSNGNEVIALTNDFLLEMKLERYGLKTMRPFAGTERPDEQDEVSVRLKRLERALSERPIPDIKAHWPSDETDWSTAFGPVPALPTPLEEGDAVPRFRQRPARGTSYGEWVIEPNEDRVPLMRRVGRAIYAQERMALDYNSRVDDYLKLYQVFYESEVDRLYRRSRVVSLDITIRNEGRAPASSPRVRIALPPSLLMPTSEPLWGAQSAVPSPPMIPTPAGQLAVEACVKAERSTSAHLFLGNDPHRLIRKSDRVAEARLPDLQQGDERKLGALRVLASEELAGTSGQIIITTWADQLPEPSVAFLQLRIIPRK